MQRQIPVIALLLTLSSHVPAMADDLRLELPSDLSGEGSKVSTPAVQPGPTIMIKVAPQDEARSIAEKPQEPKADANVIKGRVTALPAATAGVVCGVTVGVPVKIAKTVAKESLRMKQQLSEDMAGQEKPDIFSTTLGSYMAMPYGVVSGVIYGTIKGVQRGVECGRRKPLSKESMSLTDPN